MNAQTKELNRSNNKLDKQVNTKNNDALTDIVCYLRGANISEHDQEVVRNDLLEMVLSAQKRGENIQSIIGEDYKVFCDEIIANLPPKSTKQKVIYFFDTICLCMSILSAINIVIAKETISLIRNIATGKPLSFEISISQGSIVNSFVVIVAAFIIVNIITKRSFQIGKLSISKVKGFLVGCGIMAAFLFIAWIGRSTLFTVNIFVAFIVAIILFIAHKILSKMQ